MSSSHRHSIYCILFALLTLSCLRVFKTEDGEIDTLGSSVDPLEVHDIGSTTRENISHSLGLSGSNQETSYNGNNQDNLADILTTPSRISGYNFAKCSMSKCFDFSRCLADGVMGVYIVPKSTDHSPNITELGESNIIHAKIIKIIRNSKYHQPDPEKACIRVLEDDTLDRDPLSKSFKTNLPNLLTPEHDYGLNYLVFNLYSGSWPDYRENDFADFKLGAAILAKASLSHSSYRSDFDISIPLFSHLHPTNDCDRTSYNESERTYLLTFKGKRYVYGFNSETRNSLYHLNNNRDVVLLTTCRHGKKWRDSTDGRCQQDDLIYDKYDFVDLMIRSKFCLTPRGRRLGSFRFLEAMSFGCIPVIMSDGWVKPFGEIIDWSKSVMQFDEESILLVPDMLRDISSQSISKMRDNLSEVYAEYFSTTERIIVTTLDILEQRLKRHIAQNPRNESE